MKKIILRIALIFFVILTFNFFVSQCIKFEFYFKDIQNMSNNINCYESKEKCINDLIDEFGVSRTLAEKIYEKPNNYSFITLQCFVTNNSPFNIFGFKFIKWASHKGVVLDDYYYVTVNSRKVKRFSKNDLLVAMILEYDTDFDISVLYDCKFKTIGVSNIGLLFLNNSSFKGYSGKEQVIHERLEYYFNDTEDYKAFFTLYNESGECTFNSSYNYLPKSAVRIKEKTNYRFSVFKDEGITRYGFTFFDKNGKLLGGVLLNKLLAKREFDSITMDKSSFKDVSSIDAGSFLVEEMGDLVSYHYFDDGSYLKIFYKQQENGVLTVVKTDKNEVDFNWLDELIEQDYNLIRRQGDGSLSSDEKD